MPAKGAIEKVANDQLKNAPKATLEALFEDYHEKRRQIYFMNLIRGVFFGFGSVVGGTLVVALLLWLLSILQYVPFLEGVIEAVQGTIERGRHR